MKMTHENLWNMSIFLPCRQCIVLMPIQKSTTAKDKLKAFFSKSKQKSSKLNLKLINGENNKGELRNE